MNEAQGTYFDGKTARERSVRIVLAGTSLQFSGEGVVPQVWSGQSVRPVESYSGHGPLRVSHVERAGERLVIPVGEFAASVAAAMPGLQAPPAHHTALRLAGWIVGGIATLAALAYGLMEFAPNHFAVLLPTSFTEKMGRDMEKTLVEGAKVCSAPAGSAALSQMVAKLLEGDASLPPLTIQVYDMALVNAFTLSGGRVVLTRGLIKDAKSADEVAGVLAHEIGHAKLLHPEAQLVRILGLELVLKVVSGGASGNTTASFAGLAALLRSSREAEREADAYARQLMLSSHIDPAGLKAFFETLLKMEKTFPSLTKPMGKIWQCVCNSSRP